MFERFTKEARATVTAAQAEAGDVIGPEHLLIGVAVTPCHAADVLARHGATPEALRGSPGDALAAIGIDLDEVRRHVEASFGPGALDRRPRRGRHRPFAPEAKKALELALREALHRGDREIGAEHVLLGLLRAGEVDALLTAVGAQKGAIRAELTRAGAR